MSGDVVRVIRIFSIPGNRIARHPAPMATAPTRPPTRACDELLGNPRYQVNKFQKMALIKAARITIRLIASEATTSCPIVSATATPNMNGPQKLARAVIPRALRGENARLATMVATMLLESWIPFKKSNIRAKMIVTMSKADKENLYDYEIFTIISAITLAASSPLSAALLR